MIAISSPIITRGTVTVAIKAVIATIVIHPNTTVNGLFTGASVAKLIPIVANTLTNVDKSCRVEGFIITFCTETYEICTFGAIIRAWNTEVVSVIIITIITLNS